MKLRSFSYLIGFSLLLVYPLLSLAAPSKSDAHICHDVLGHLSLPSIRLFNSGRDATDENKLKDAANIIYRDVALRLGYSIPDMVIKSLDQTEMHALTSNAGHPAPHWHDGMNVMQSSARSGSILEFVEAGRNSHVQFLRDTNSFKEHLIVFSHVVGHYDFAVNNYFFKVRRGDRIRDSYELADRMSKLYTQYDYEEVSQFYQRLLSFKHLQDVGRGSFVPPEKFKPAPIEGRLKLQQRVDPFSFAKTEAVQDPQTHPTAPTQSVLQALVYNLPPTAPAWQTEIFVPFERLHRAGIAIMQTKIMNEGWATFAELMLLKHSPWNDGASAVDFAQINSGVTRPSFSNPYWIGLEAWMHLYRKFLRSPEIEKLSSFEQDKAFIAYAANYRDNMNDYDFLKSAFDREWIEKYSLLLYRKATDEEAGGDSAGGGGLFPQPQQGEEEKNIAITRDADRIIQYIVTRYANFDFKMPHIEIVDFNEPSQGAVLLRHSPKLGIPLERSSTAKTLFVLAQLLKRPAIMQTIGSTAWLKQQSRRSAWDPPDPEPALDTFPLEVTVTPAGVVSVKVPEKFKGLEFESQLVERMTAAVESLRLDQSISQGISPQLTPKMDSLISAAMATQGRSIENLANTIGHAPTAAEAVFKFQQMAKRRTRQILRLAAEGKWKVFATKNGKGVRIRVLPEIPEFALDYSVFKKRNKTLQPTPPDFRFRAGKNFAADSDFPLFSPLETKPNDNQVDAMEASTKEGDFLPDEDLEIGSGPYLPGDLWPVKSQGQGQGEGEGEEGEEGEEDGESGNQAGQGNGNDPDMVEVPIEEFGKMIIEQIGLKNVRHTEGGQNPTLLELRTGNVQAPTGLLRDEATAMEDFARGFALLKGQGKDPRKIKPLEIIQLGVKHRPAAEQVVAAHDVEKIPDMDAVIVYVADTSGSMDEEARAAERRIVFYTSAVLRTVYPGLRERFIIVGDKAKEVGREKFFSTYTGGGTQIDQGLNLTEEILEKEYPLNRFNRYVLLFSDGGDFKVHKTICKLKDLIKMTEYFGYSHIDSMGFGLQPLSIAVQGMVSSHKEKLGFAMVNSTHESVVEALRTFFGKSKKK